MKERLESLVIAKSEKIKPDEESENIKTEIICIDDEIRKLMDKLADADDILFEYIQNRVKELHAKKSELDEKHALAVTMIDVIYVSDEHGIEINFSI